MTTIHAPFTTEVECKIASVRSSAEILAGAAKSVSRSSHARVSAAGLAPIQAKLSRNSNQIARGRIRRFESYMPSHAVVSNFMNLKTAHRPCSRTAGVRQHSRTTCCGRFATAVK